MQGKTYTAVRVERGPQGWGGPLVIEPTVEKNKISAVTGGGIPEVAKKIAELSGAEAVDGFRNPPPESEVAAVVVDCGGTARTGVYPRKRIPTVNLTPVGQSGPLAQFITEDIYVSGVRPDNVNVADESEAAAAEIRGDGQGGMASPFAASGAGAGSGAAQPDTGGGVSGFIARIGRAMGGVVGTLFQSGRQAIDQVVRNILPFMAFVTLLIGLINASGLGDLIANALAPLAGNIVGLLILSAIVTLPFLSPILAPGAVIAAVVGTVIGDQIARGSIEPAFALPALFAFNAQVGCDFAPVGMALGEAEPKTTEVGVPALLFSRQITGPIAVIVGFLFSIGLYS